MDRVKRTYSRSTKSTSSYSTSQSKPVDGKEKENVNVKRRKKTEKKEKLVEVLSDNNQIKNYTDSVFDELLSSPLKQPVEFKELSHWEKKVKELEEKSKPKRNLGLYDFSSSGSGSDQSYKRKKKKPRKRAKKQKEKSDFYYFPIKNITRQTKPKYNEAKQRIEEILKNKQIEDKKKKKFNFCLEQASEGLTSTPMKMTATTDFSIFQSPIPKIDVTSISSLGSTLGGTLKEVSEGTPTTTFVKTNELKVPLIEKLRSPTEEKHASVNSTLEIPVPVLMVDDLGNAGYESLKNGIRNNSLDISDLSSPFRGFDVSDLMKQDLIPALKQSVLQLTPETNSTISFINTRRKKKITNIEGSASKIVKSAIKPKKSNKKITKTDENLIVFSSNSSLSDPQMCKGSSHKKLACSLKQNNEISSNVEEALSGNERLLKENSKEVFSDSPEKIISDSERVLSDNSEDVLRCNYESSFHSIASLPILPSEKSKQLCDIFNLKQSWSDEKVSYVAKNHSERCNNTLEEVQSRQASPSSDDNDMFTSCINSSPDNSEENRNISDGRVLRSSKTILNSSPETKTLKSSQTSSSSSIETKNTTKKISSGSSFNLKTLRSGRTIISSNSSFKSKTSENNQSLSSSSSIVFKNNKILSESLSHMKDTESSSVGEKSLKSYQTSSSLSNARVSNSRTVISSSTSEKDSSDDEFKFRNITRRRKLTRESKTLNQSILDISSSDLIPESSNKNSTVSEESTLQNKTLMEEESTLQLEQENSGTILEQSEIDDEFVIPTKKDELLRSDVMAPPRPELQLKTVKLIPEHRRPHTKNMMRPSLYFPSKHSILPFNESMLPEDTVGLDRYRLPGGKRYSRCLSIINQYKTGNISLCPDNSILCDGANKGEGYFPGVVDILTKQPALNETLFNKTRLNFTMVNSTLNTTVTNRTRLNFTMANDTTCRTRLSGVVCSVPQNLTPRQMVLAKCAQTEPLSFSDYYNELMLPNCRKIGEGVFGEVFMYGYDDNNKTVFKVIPIEGEILVNGEHQKTFAEVLSEVIILSELSNLRTNYKNQAEGFVETTVIRCVVGEYPEYLLDLWDEYNNRKKSENDNPCIFPSNQLYIVLEMSHGGQDVEAYVFKNALQSVYVLYQIALSLAVAESALQFEHRDMHWGNVLAADCEETEINFILNEKEIVVPSGGVKISIIDFTLSRMTYERSDLYFDMSVDPELFQSYGDYQFDIYRMMRDHNNNTWDTFNPKTNIYWLHYTVDKMINGYRYQVKGGRIHNKGLKMLKDIKDNMLDYNSAKDFVLATVGDVT